MLLLCCQQLMGLPDDPTLSDSSLGGGGNPSSGGRGGDPVAGPQRPPVYPGGPASPAETPAPSPMPTAGGPGEGSTDGSAQSGGTPAGDEAQQPVVVATPGDAGASRADAGEPEDDAPPDPAAEEPTCKVPQQIGPDGRCYAFLSGASSWLAARDTCSTLGPTWDLVSIRSEEVNDFVAAMVDQSASTEAWIGGSDAALEGDWIWVDDGTLFFVGDGDTGAAHDDAFTLFGTSEPNGGVDSACLRVRDSGSWADFECEELLPAVCSGPPEPG